MRPVAGVEAGVEAGQEPVLAEGFRISVPVVPERGQDDLGCEGKGRGGCPGRQGSIVGSKGNSPGYVAVELPLDAPLRALLREAGAEAGGEPPTVLTVPLEPHGVAQGVLLLNNGGPAAVLEIVGPLFPHERILDAAQVDPDVRELVDEERRREEVIDVVEVLPLIGPAPRAVALRGQWVCGRAQAEDVEQHRLAVSLPAVAQETGPGFPSHVHHAAVRGGPGPVDPLVEEPGKIADLPFVVRRGGEVHAAREDAGDQNRGVDHRQLALPNAPASLHVEEVVVEASMAGGVRLLALGAVAKESQRGQRPRGGVATGEEAPLRTNDIGGQSEPGCGDAAWGTCTRAVGDQPVIRVRGSEQVFERLPLEDVQHSRVTILMKLARGTHYSMYGMSDMLVGYA